MQQTTIGEGAAAPSGQKPIRVWDPVVRIFHWGTVVACTLNLFILDPGKSLHRYTGYTVLGLLAVRLVWGFIGTRHARFADFVASPRRILAYLAQLRAGKAPRFIGHNPAASVMMLALMALLAGTGISGWMSTLDAFWGNELVEEAHELMANGIMVLVAVHALAAIAESVLHRENLILSMVTGTKRP